MKGLNGIGGKSSFVQSPLKAILLRRLGWLDQNDGKFLRFATGEDSGGMFEVDVCGSCGWRDWEGRS